MWREIGIRKNNRRPRILSARAGDVCRPARHRPTALPNPELENLLRELLATNCGPGYGISVLSAAADLSVIDVELRFIAGRTYCCAEPGCHLPRSNSMLVSLAAERGLRLPDSVAVRWHCHVDRGALLQSMKSLGLPIESEAYEFEAIRGGSVSE